MTPEQLVVENIKAFMKARGVGRSELGKRLNDLGFTSWRHAKTVRNLLDDERSLRVNELFAMAAALNTSILALTSPKTLTEVFPSKGEPAMQVGEVVRGRQAYESIWLGATTITSPHDHLDWAAWEPGEKPLWVNRRLRENKRLIELFEQRGFSAPAPAEELTTAQAIDIFRILEEQLEHYGENE